MKILFIDALFAAYILGITGFICIKLILKSQIAREYIVKYRLF